MLCLFEFVLEGGGEVLGGAEVGGTLVESFLVGGESVFGSLVELVYAFGEGVAVGGLFDCLSEAVDLEILLSN